MTGVILAGGKSTRMGTNKAFLELGGKKFIQRVIDVFLTLFDEILLISNEPELYKAWGFQVVPDVLPDKGSLGGIYTGLVTASQDQAFFAACDMPFLNQNLIQYMIDQAPGFDVVIPYAPTEENQSSEGLHPLHAIYSKACTKPIERLLERNSFKIIGFFPEVRVRRILPAEIRPFDPNLLSFFNANTPQDLEFAKSLINNNRL
jgi:molybdopterin-guanine dinucleotide biosynthesis protein A